MSNFKDNFDKLSKSVGLTVAIITLESTLPIDFWELLTFEELVTIYKEGYGHPQIQASALTQLEKIPGTFNQWYKINPSCVINQDINILTYKKLIDLAVNFDEVSKSICKYESYNKDPNLTKIAQEKMFNLATIFDDWCLLCNYPEYKIIALEKIILLGKTSNDLIKINYYNPTPETLSGTIVAIESDFGDPLEKWGKVLQKIQLSDDLKKTSLQKISELMR